MTKYIKKRRRSSEIDTKNPEFIGLVKLIQVILKAPRKKSSKGLEQGELLVEFIRALTKESTKSFRSEFANLMGLKQSSLNTVLYQGNITGHHLANILLQLTNTTAEEFISEFFYYLIDKRVQEKPPEWLKIFMKIKNLTDEEKKYIAMIGFKFDDMIEQRKK